VQALRPGFGAERAGVRPGMEITAVDGVPVEQAIRPFLGRALRQADAAARNFALQQLLAGDHRHPRTWTLRAGGKALSARPDEPTMQLENIHYPARLEARRLGTIGYVKVNNCLFDNALIAAFDSALTSLQGTAGLILDLRETASGGNSAVARAMMGRFISQEGAYQRHELPAEEAQTGIRRSWLELVSPRGPRYAAPLLVLAGRWTGSMGEGLTIGFDALHRATVVGSEMAQLNGAIYSYSLPHSGIGFNIPVERLFHVDGRPRETFRPPVYVDPKTAPAQAAAADPVLEKALEILRRKK
jgi:C-terminal processing protease CtpA/Prc